MYLATDYFFSLKIQLYPRGHILFGKSILNRETHGCLKRSKHPSKQNDELHSYSRRISLFSFLAILF